MPSKDIEKRREYWRIKSRKYRKNKVGYKEKAREYGKKYRQENELYFKEYNKKWSQENKLHLKEYRENNKDKLREKRRIWYYEKGGAEAQRIYCRYKMTPETIEKISLRKKEYYKINREKILAYGVNRAREQRASNPAYRIKGNIKNYLNHVLRKEKIAKEERTRDYVGCSFEELKNHLEKQFKPGMNWENRAEWHIDHITPVDYFVKNFDFTDIKIQKKCFHYTNLQPLWARENLSKGKKIGVSNG
tara:strand:- start:35 stop:775 length:741 start_codon:yes stop_codon:yes gene_type:complete